MKSKKPRPWRTPLTMSETLALLNNSEFCSAGHALLARIANFASSTHDLEQRNAFLLEQTLPFLQRWQTLPPQAPNLVSPDSRRELVAAIASGRWGLVPIFASTTNKQIMAAARTIRRTIHQEHQDAENARRAQLSAWLESLGFSRPEIAKAIWGRRDGLRRPTRGQALGRISEREETALLDTYLAEGLTRNEAEQRIYKLLRGSEPKATAAVRMARRRYTDRLKTRNTALAAPVMSEPISHALTLVLRAETDGADAEEIRRLVAALRKALIKSLRA
jgi:hypothetical protein